MPVDIKNLQRARKKKDDEFYSPREQVECIFNKYIAPDALRGKKIWLPADSEQSEWVKYLKDNKEKWQYKEIIYTCDDFRTHKDILDNVDIVITNPPFSLKMDLVKMCQEAGKDFILLWSFATLHPKGAFAYRYTLKDEVLFTMFNRPDGTQRGVKCYIITSKRSLMMSIDEIKSCVRIKGITLEQGLKTGKIRVADDGKYEVNDSHNAPVDYFDWLYMPFSTLRFENTSLRDLFDIDFTPTAAIINGKSTYLRYLARRKKQ